MTEIRIEKGPSSDKLIFFIFFAQRFMLFLGQCDSSDKLIFSFFTRRFILFLGQCDSSDSIL